ncbi:MAG: hypothetical protein LBE27_02765, partial [Deltaproteobacteria bacterium]|nr:hypothetical protein [Deltaproteobacteria bacterium]
MSIKFLEGGCIFSFDNFGPEFIFPPPEHDYIMEGKIYGSPTGPVPAEKVIADPNILNDIESDASIIAYNKEDNSLLLIRDAVGATPLFYARTDEGCNASFNLSLLLKTLKKPPKHNEDAFYDFLATHYRYVFRESFRTFHHGVYQVPAGHYILIQENDVITNQYLDLAFDTNAQKMSFDDASHEYIRILDENVGLRLSALPDKSFAFTVSSGLDSSTVASLAARRLKTPLDTFTMSYSSAKGTPYDETPGVRALLASTDWKLNNLEMDAPL